MTPTRFKHKIQILSQAAGGDAYGEKTGAWSTYKEAWASKEPILGNEFFNAMVAQTKVDVKYGFRHITGITDKMRIQHGTEVYEIISVVDIKSKHREMLCYCRLVVV